MEEAKSREAWWHTAQLMSLLANIHRPKGKRPFKPADFHPYTQARRRQRVSVERLTDEMVRIAEQRR
jgi:2-polyprenyl-6-methoxyphenol hydroxylase-like FAD-dependent oxidoreductase